MAANYSTIVTTWMASAEDSNRANSIFKIIGRAINVKRLVRKAGKVIMCGTLPAMCRPLCFRLTM